MAYCLTMARSEMATVSSTEIGNAAPRWLDYLVFINGFCLSLYLYFASSIWAPVGDEGLLGGPGDGVIWTMLALPWIALAFAIDLIALVLAIASLTKRGKWRPAITLLALVTLWIAALEIDHGRRYTGEWVANDAKSTSAY